MNRIFAAFLTALFAAALSAAPPDSGRSAREIFRFPAPEAVQGVAADGDSVYVFANRTIGKYGKKNGEKTGGWQDDSGGPFRHLNAGVVDGGRLYGAHSNFPGVPMTSSVEIWDTGTLEHLGSVSFGILPAGSLTWLARNPGTGVWYYCFVNYDSPKSGVPGRGAGWSFLAKGGSSPDAAVPFSESWVFPPELVEEFSGGGASGGAFGSDGRLYVSGHDAPKLYVLEFPKAGSQLQWVDTVTVTFHGQAFVFDPENPNLIYGIDRKTKEVVVDSLK